MVPLSIDLAEHGIESLWLAHRQAARRVLFVYAHPDDETFANAGTIARYSAAGVAAHVVCATNGECGTVAPALLRQHHTIAALRRAELRCAAHTLGLASIHFLNYRDSGMRGAPDNADPQALMQASLAHVVDQIVAVMRVVKPHVVITFNSYGGYGHPDHIAVHRATINAWFAANDARQVPDLAPWQPRKLYYTTISARWLRRVYAVLQLIGKDPRHFGVNADTDLIEAATRAGTSTTQIRTAAFAAQQERAWRCYASQLGDLGLLLRLPHWARARLMGTEHFTRVVPRWHADQARETDLFAGLGIWNEA